MKPPEQFPVLNHQLSIPTTPTITVTTTSTTSTTIMTNTTAMTISNQLLHHDTATVTQSPQNNNNILVRPPQPQHHLLPLSLKQDTISRLKPSKYDKQVTAVAKSKVKALDVSNLLPSNKTLQQPPLTRDPETPVLNVPDPAKVLASLPSSASLWDYRYSTVRY